MGAALLSTPEFNISEAEAKRLNDSVTDVMRFYTDVDIPPKTQAWLNLAMVAGTIYGPRILAVKIRRSKMPPKTVSAVPSGAGSGQPSPPRSNVTPIQPAPKQATQPTQGPATSDEMRAWSQWNSQQAFINPAD